MRRLVLAALLLAPMLAPASAMAEGFVIEFRPDSIGVTNFTDCPGTSCDDVPVALVLERGGIAIETSAVEERPYIVRSPRPGDVVRILLDGVERAAVPYEAQPAVDDVSCAIVGSTALTGSFRRGVAGLHTIGSPGYGLQIDDYTVLRVALSNVPLPGTTEAAITTAGDRWTAVFTRPLRPDDGILLGLGYTIATPVGSAAVLTARSATVCPTPPVPFEPPPASPAPVPVPPACAASAIRAAAPLAAAVRRLRLRTLRRGRAALSGLPACAGGRLRVTIATTRGRDVVVAKGTAAATGAPVTLTPTRRAARLAGRRKARLLVTLGLTDASGATAEWTRRATLRLR